MSIRKKGSDVGVPDKNATLLFLRSGWRTALGSARCTGHTKVHCHERALYFQATLKIRWLSVRGLGSIFINIFLFFFCLLPSAPAKAGWSVIFVFKISVFYLWQHYTIYPAVFFASAYYYYPTAKFGTNVAHELSVTSVHLQKINGGHGTQRLLAKPRYASFLEIST